MPQVGGFSPDIEGIGVGFIKKPAPASAKAGFFLSGPDQLCGGCNKCSASKSMW
jgi:hypothetical protein